jgi:hypothetical protein
MINIDPDAQDKVDEYLRVIQERILAPLEIPAIQNSCTATLLLLFAAFNGLGRLIHSKTGASETQRISEYLQFMGGEYSEHTNELLNLRHKLVHNAINVESYLSRTETGKEYHLKKIGAAGFLYVNTVVFSKDFSASFKRFGVYLHQNPNLMERAAKRLEWRDDDPPINLISSSGASLSFPPPVQFIQTRK